MADIEHRLLFAFRLAASVRSLVAGHRDGLGPAASIVSDDRLHMTLAITSDHPQLPCAAADMLCAIGSSLTASPIALRLDQLSGARGSIALRPARRIKALSELTATLNRRMAAAGLLRDKWRCHPHVTLLYRAGAPFSRPIDPICWTATDFVLIHSIVGATRHIELGRWPLIERQGSFGF
ncbi:2'-5' RNA ligase family protein [Sphingomonas pituitosa]|uniref:2'-5' RNA ligase family protein n=1 Tax=Sphingomonas pituitosa TaxID=99597 RepID=UPI0008368CCB|nr:2'-5' RNA ligase family protein [Sphingomonas pituitosa]